MDFMNVCCSFRDFYFPKALGRRNPLFSEMLNASFMAEAWDLWSITGLLFIRNAMWRIRHAWWYGIMLLLDSNKSHASHMLLHMHCMNKHQLYLREQYKYAILFCTSYRQYCWCDVHTTNIRYHFHQITTFELKHCNALPILHSILWRKFKW